MKLSRKDAAAHLGVSLATLDRHIKAGKLNVTYGEPNRLGKRTVFVDFPEIPEPTPEPVTVAPAPEPMPMPVLPLVSQIEERLLDDAEFARRYIEGEIGDTYGNTFRRTRYSALGPAPPIERRPEPINGHIHPALMPNLAQPSADSMEHPLNKNFRGIERPARPRHPNQTRQELLNAIWSDIRRGFSR
jgi:hypothetical protein